MPSIDVIAAIGLSALPSKTYSAPAPAVDVQPHEAVIDAGANAVAATLAAPGAAMKGKFIHVRASDVSNAATLAFADPGGAKTATFDAVDDGMILFGVGETAWQAVTTPNGGIA